MTDDESGPNFRTPQASYPKGQADSRRPKSEPLGPF
jgi:hypothetical protein